MQQQKHTKSLPAQIYIIYIYIINNNSMKHLATLTLAFAAGVSDGFRPRPLSTVCLSQGRLARPSAPLYAKKKASKLISDDFLSTIDDLVAGDDGDQKEKASPVKQVQANQVAAVATPPQPPKKKLSKEEKKLAMFGLLDTAEEKVEETDFEKEQRKLALANNIGADAIVVEEILQSTEGKKNKKNKNKNKESTPVAIEEVSVSEIAEVELSSADSLALDTDNEGDDDFEDSGRLQPTDGLTVEERIRKERPASRVRFAESSQPDFVMVELDKVSVVFGNSLVVKDASFDVKTGERVGLVGPNGGGKTTLLKILSGVSYYAIHV